MAFPLKMLGADLQRIVTLIRLKSGRLLIHSTAPFGSADVAAIKSLGEPAWLLEGLARHDTFSREGHEAFPETEYLVPDGFPEIAGLPTTPVFPPPAEWDGEVDISPVEGVPQFGEIAVFHSSSRTLIVGDLLFHFPGSPGVWKSLLLTLGMVGGKREPGVSKPFRNAIADEAAFARSLGKILEWDFDRIVVGHGEPIESDAKKKLLRAWKDAGIPLS